MIKGRRACQRPATPITNVIAINTPSSICDAPVNSTINIPIVITSDPLPLPSNDAQNWGYELVSGDQPLPLSAAGQFKVRTCLLDESAVTGAGSYISMSHVFAVTGANPRPTVIFYNTAGWVKLKVYATDGYTVVSTGVIVVGTSSTQCQAALGVFAN